MSKSILELLLSPELPNVQKELPTAQYRIKRLSEQLGTPVDFTLRGLPYGRVEELRKSMFDDTEIQIVLAGVTEPDLRSTELAKKYGGATPAETIKSILLPGEIEDLSRAVERLCGYRMTTIEEIKNASGTAATQS